MHSAAAPVGTAGAPVALLPAQVQFGAVFADLTACNNYSGGEAAMERVACPIQFISGIQDRMAPCNGMVRASVPIST